MIDDPALALIREAVRKLKDDKEGVNWRILYEVHNPSLAYTISSPEPITLQPIVTCRLVVWSPPLEIILFVEQKEV